MPSRVLVELEASVHAGSSVAPGGVEWFLRAGTEVLGVV